MKDKRKMDRHTKGYLVEYARSNYDSMQIVLRKGDRAKVREYAKKEGITVSSLIRRALNELYDLKLEDMEK